MGVEKMPIIMICITLVIVAILFYLFFKHNALDKSDEATMISRGPIISYKIPGMPKAEKQVLFYRTTIGQEGNDIVLSHTTVSKKHAEIICKCKKDKHMFILKNLSKTNPILQIELNEDGKVKNTKEILKDVMLKIEQNNYFKFGDVDVNIYFPLVSEDKTSIQNFFNNEEKQEISYKKEKIQRGTRRIM